MKSYSGAIDWLLTGDVAIQYQTQRDLLGSCNERLNKLKSRIASEGWGARILNLQNDDGHWGQGFYKPKWTSSHYTLLDLRNLCVNATSGIRKAISLIITEHKGIDGGISRTGGLSDVCVNGMFLNYACYFKTDESDLESVIDFIIGLQMADGGFNCWKNRWSAEHSSLHSTISVLEGINEYLVQGYSYRADQLISIEKQAIEFMLEHKLFKSDKTDQVIHKGMTMLSYPSRWKHNILRGLDYLQKAKVPYDARMEDAIEVLLRKRRKEGVWPVQAKHSGSVHFDMEKTGAKSRWNTLRALRVLKYYDIE